MRTAATAWICLGFLAAMPGVPCSMLRAAETRAAFLAAQPLEKLGDEERAAWELARKLDDATLVIARGGGQFQSSDGKGVELGAFRTIWYHQGSTTERIAVIRDETTIKSLRDYAAAGNGLLLSGAAFELVHELGIEPCKPRLGGPGDDRYVAGIVPAVPSHPVLEGLKVTGVDLDPSVGGNPRVASVAINDRGFSAFADFAGTGGPKAGMVIARASATDENPLVEYALDKGRVLVLGWRLTRYSNAANVHRDNLERLTRNMLAYLAAPDHWQTVSQRPVQEQPPKKSVATVTDAQWEALRRAVVDLNQTYGDRYPNGRRYLRLVNGLKEAQKALVDAGPDLDKLNAFQLKHIGDDFRNLQRDALLANPLLDFDRLLLIERDSKHIGLPANWQSNSSLPTAGYENRLAVLSPVRPDGQLTTLYQPEGGRFVGDVDLHFDADRLLFSMPGSHGRWQVFELGLKDATAREVPLITEPDVDNYDACYLPDDRIAFTSTAPFVGVPCVYGDSHVTNLYRRDHDGTIRQLTVDQEHNWCPVVNSTGRVMYLRWEYTDLPHSNSRRLFHMNPDGTAQMEYYGSSSFFPNSFFYARPIPNHPTKVVGIATGHHGVARAGRMLVLDPAKGRQEADGVVQEIPGWGKKVDAIIRDPLVDGVWPQFLHPFPLSDKYFLVSAKPNAESPWGIYLVDVFDNMLLLRETPGKALLEPVPLRKTARPPVVPDRVDLQRKDAVVYMTDVYQGPGLKGIPRGAVKKLRLVSYQFSYRNMGGLLGTVGMDGPWDVKRIIGTVPVEADGSAQFRVPACTPIAVQPLDSEGRALQLMRSWFTAMPGEVVTCVGCHERQNESSPNLVTKAAKRPPDTIEPWHGPPRGFSFAREVQPVLDKHCTRCHDGQPHDGTTAADLRGGTTLKDWTSGIAGHVATEIGGKFSTSYAELHRFVRRPGIESDIRLLSPMEFHASTTELVQMLALGHHGVQLEPESWDRLFTWIDLNAPFHGSWSEIVGADKTGPLIARASEMRRRYAGMDDSAEFIGQPASLGAPSEPQAAKAPAGDTPAKLPDWPFDAAEAQRRQAAGGQTEMQVDLGSNVQMAFVRIPSGRFHIGSRDGLPREQPSAAVNIDKAFWMGRFEVTNEQYRAFDPTHDSRVEPMHGYQFGIRGYPVDRPKQPVVRLSWSEAVGFCRWLSERTGKRVKLPTEAQWEYACRAGSSGPFWYGDLNTDFSRMANLGDAKLREFALDTYVQVQLVSNPNRYDDWVPKDDRFMDGGFVSMPVGSYAANPWGLYDMHGNVWEWTRSLDRPYPYADEPGNDSDAVTKRIVRGGSWYDRPARSTSSFRLSYEPFQPVFNVGFRVIIEED